MRRKTIARRLRLMQPTITQKEIDNIYDRMSGVNDVSTQHNQKGNSIWVDAVKRLLRIRKND